MHMYVCTMCVYIILYACICTSVRIIMCMCVCMHTCMLYKECPSIIIRIHGRHACLLRGYTKSNTFSRSILSDSPNAKSCSRLILLVSSRDSWSDAEWVRSIIGSDSSSSLSISRFWIVIGKNNDFNYPASILKSYTYNM